MLRSTLAASTCLFAVMAGGALAQTSHPAHLPTTLPDAEIGQCYQFVRIDAEYETVMQTVIVADEYEIYDVTDPRLERQTRSYVSREAGMRYRVTEPVYEDVTEQVQTRPAYVRYEVTPAETRTVSERILVREAQLVWRRGYVEGARQVRHDPESGEIWCMIEEPAVYETIHRNVVTSQAEVREIPVGPQFETITRSVLVRPATVEEIHIPAEHASYDIHVLAEEGEVHRRVSRQRTEQVARHELIAGERFEWRLVNCASIDIPGYPGANPPSSAPAQSHGPHMMSQSQSRYDYDTPSDEDAGEYEAVPVAHSQTLHPGAPARRSRLHR
ncbi:MAG: hypothetical protein GYB36_05625 [Alphaproteobacteria bacterium]|nr:hypothetical protein [Alphaproteobacteria bacterium]